MAIPKWMYRKHPIVGNFQSTHVTTEKAAEELAAEGWSDNADEHGVAVRPAAQMHPAHAAAGPVYEVAGTAAGQPVTPAEIALTVEGDRGNA